MNPKLQKQEFVFCTVDEAKFKLLKITPILIFREEEGLTIILEKTVALKNELAFSGVWAMITLLVNSDLTAVGFLAAITKKLAEAGISVNAVSAFYHDHLFVPFEKADKAISLLKELSSE